MARRRCRVHKHAQPEDLPGVDSLARDPVFGTGNFAYKLDAITRTISVGGSQALSPRATLNLSYQRQMTHGAGDNNYFKNVFTATYAHGFF